MHWSNTLVSPISAMTWLIHFKYSLFVNVFIKFGVSAISYIQSCWASNFVFSTTAIPDLCYLPYKISQYIEFRAGKDTDWIGASLIGTRTLLWKWHVAAAQTCSTVQVVGYIFKWFICFLRKCSRLLVPLVKSHSPSLNGSGNTAFIRDISKPWLVIQKLSSWLDTTNSKEGNMIFFY